MLGSTPLDGRKARRSIGRFIVLMLFFRFNQTHSAHALRQATACALPSVGDRSGVLLLAAPLSVVAMKA